jgi:hypothetical protein
VRRRASLKRSTTFCGLPSRLPFARASERNGNYLAIASGLVDSFHLEMSAAFEFSGKVFFADAEALSDRFRETLPGVLWISFSNPPSPRRSHRRP